MPPAYLDVEVVRTPKEALETYVEILEEWLGAALRGDSVDSLMPVTHRNSIRPVPIKGEIMDGLAHRLDFIRSEMLPELAR